MTKLLNLRVDETLLAAFDAECAKCGVSRSACLREFMETFVEAKATRLSVARPPVRHETAIRNANPARRLNPVAKEKLARGSTASRTACVHPKEQLQKLGYLTKCGVCGTRVR